MGIRHTDVLVVGGELAGAVAAAVCARAGRRVVVLEEGEGDDGTVVGGVLCPPVDDLWPLLDDLPRAMAPLDALGQRGDLKRTMPTAVRGIQLVDPAHRVDLFSEGERRARELARELGPDADALLAHLGADRPELSAAAATFNAVDALLVDGFFAVRRGRASVREGLARVVEAPVLGVPTSSGWLGALMRGATSFLSHSEAPPGLVVHRLVAALLHGVHCSPVGGRNALRAQLLEAARQRGAEVIHDERAAAFVVEGGKISEVRLAGRSDALSARALVDATRTRDLRDRVSPEKHARKVDALQDRARPERTRVGFTWTLKTAGIPPGLGERLLLAADGDGPGSDVALLGLTAHPVAAETRKPASGLAVLTACVPCKPADATTAVDRLRARVEALLPFSRRHLVEEKVSGTEPRQQVAAALYAGPEDAAELGGRSLETGFKGVYRAGRDVCPILGVEGELWAGHAAGVRADKWASRKPLFGGAGDAATSGLR